MSQIEEFSVYEATTTLQYSAADADGNVFFAYSSALRRMSAITGELDTLVRSVSSGTGGDMVIVGNASAAIHVGTTLEFIYLPTNTSTLTTGVNNIVSANAGRQISTNHIDTIMSTSSTPARVMRFDLISWTASSLVVPGETQNVTSTIQKNDTTDRFLVAAGPRIKEIDANGALYKTIEVDTSNNTGTPPSIVLSGITYDNDTLMAATTEGTMYQWKYSTGELIAFDYGQGNSATSGITFSDIASGLALGITSATENNHGRILTYTYAGDRLYTSGIKALGTNDGSGKAELMPSANRGYVRSGAKILVFKLPDLGVSSVETQALDQNGLNVAARIIRIQDISDGSAAVVSDQQIAASAVEISENKAGNYIEIALDTGDPPTTYDWRRFNI